MDRLELEISELSRLGPGWDGERAAAPLAAAVVEARAFARAARDTASMLDATLHVDGSVLLEADGGAEACLRFFGDGTISFAAGRLGRGSVRFDRATVPDRLARLLGRLTPPEGVMAP